MIVKLLGIRGYNYERNGELKQGIYLEVQGTDLFTDDDNHGNFKIGYIVSEVFVPKNLYSKFTSSVLQDMIGHNINIEYTKLLGDRYERLVNISLADDS